MPSPSCQSKPSPEQHLVQFGVERLLVQFGIACVKLHMAIQAKADTKTFETQVNSLESQILELFNERT